MYNAVVRKEANFPDFCPSVENFVSVIIYVFENVIFNSKLWQSFIGEL